MILIYHNDGCSKSHNALQVLEEHSIPYQLRNYILEPLTVDELSALLVQLGMQPSDLLRRNEPLYLELAQEPHTETDWLELMVRHPELIERPIAVHGQRAIVARPPECVLEIR